MPALKRRSSSGWSASRARSGPSAAPSIPSTARPTSRVRDDYLFEGYELDDALAAANEALEDDMSVSERDGRPENLKPFTRGELLEAFGTLVLRPPLVLV